jgi:hypothetical protein
VRLPERNGAPTGARARRQTKCWAVLQREAQRTVHPTEKNGAPTGARTRAKGGAEARTRRATMRSGPVIPPTRDRGIRF